LRGSIRLSFRALAERKTGDLTVRSRARSGDRHERGEGLRLTAGDGAGCRQLVSVQQSPPQPGRAAEMEAMQAKGKTTELLGQLADLLRMGNEGNNLTPS